MKFLSALFVLSYCNVTWKMDTQKYFVCHIQSLINTLSEVGHFASSICQSSQFQIKETDVS